MYLWCCCSLCSGAVNRRWRNGGSSISRESRGPFLQLIPRAGGSTPYHSYDLWDYFDEKRDALQRLEKYLRGLVSC
jgi:hypothetical protein